MKTQSVSKLRVGGRNFAVVPWVECQRLAANGKVKSPSRKRLSAEDADRRDAMNGTGGGPVSCGQTANRFACVLRALPGVISMAYRIEQ